MDKKAQATFGQVTGVVGGIAFLIIGVLIAFITIGSLGSGSNGVIPQGAYSEVNESDLNGALVSANTSAYNVDGVTLKRGSNSFVRTACWSEYYQSNGTATTTASFGGYNVSLGTANCTISTAGNLSSGTPATYNFPNVSISYTYKGDTDLILSSDNLSSNFTSGINNLSSKLPTVLLISAVVLIIAIMVILVSVWQRIRLGQTEL